MKKMNFLMLRSAKISMILSLALLTITLEVKCGARPSHSGSSDDSNTSSSTGSTGIDGGTVTSAAPTSIPSAFTLLTPTDGAGVITLIPTFSWSDSAGEQSYTFELALDKNFTAPLVYSINSIPANVIDYAIPANTLIDGLTYYWRVTAVNTKGATTATNNPYSFKITESAFSLTTPTDGSLGLQLAPILTWSDSNSSTLYTIEISTSNSFNTIDHTATVQPASTLYSIPSGTLTYSKAYYWRIKSTKSTGEMITASNAPFYFTTIDDPSSNNGNEPQGEEPGSKKPK
ncbi:MAG: hypothetical protein HY606_07130 [Planctomycetes bacterium]|nr:hypothetical protein [Planctomycetota bacterium]